MYQLIDNPLISYEANEPAIATWCENCGEPICAGQSYYEHEGLSICRSCKTSYALSIFERDAQRKTAEEPE